MFLVVSQGLNLGIPFTIILFERWDGPIAPYFALSVLNCAFGYRNTFTALLELMVDNCVYK